jgi:hypothetical protein
VFVEPEAMPSIELDLASKVRVSAMITEKVTVRALEFDVKWTFCILNNSM